MEMLPICPRCGSKNYNQHNSYETKQNGKRTQYFCKDCKKYFSETAGTIAHGLKTPISVIIKALKARSLSLNATCRLMNIAKKTFMDSRNTHWLLQ